MRPVDAKWPVSQRFGEGATAGVAPSSNPASGVGYLVYLYGNYQPFGHAGEDIACPVGTPVHAMADGVVLWADWGWKLPGDDSEAGYRQRWYLYKDFPGIVTVIQHPGWIGVYAHLSSNDSAPKGSRVSAGQVIALSGASSGRSANGVGAHLHREALIDLSYRTGGGLIYGRTDPANYDGGIFPSGTVTPSTEEYIRMWTDKIQEYKEDGRTPAAVKTAGFILGNLNQWVTRILRGQADNKALLKTLLARQQANDSATHLKLNAIAKALAGVVDYDRIQDGTEALLSSVSLVTVTPEAVNNDPEETA
ncbi:M23 family metallopeptidase [Arthrobacter sp. R-11]|uniref:M23 family metallopeptidase n=1 Tax=Arthrobacter sp. R-11 TaxID=3404053 RepID=UPI003CEFC65D